MPEPSILSGLGTAFSFLVIFLIVVYMAYVFTKWFAMSKSGRKAGSNIKVIESLPVGYQNMIQLIQVGSKYFLVGVSKDRVDFLTEVDGEGLITTTETPSLVVPFEKHLSKFKENKDKMKKE